MQNDEIILAAETQFAREVTIGVTYQRPLSAWYYLIPGMFVIDFLRRGTAIRRYTETFMFPRKLALQAARDLLSGYENTSVERRIENEIKAWLDSHNLFSSELFRAQKKAIEVLLEHYTKLLQADGDRFYDIIEAAYKSRSDFQEFIEQISAAEKEVDQAILALRADSEQLQIKLQLEEQQVAQRRSKILEAIY